MLRSGKKGVCIWRRINSCHCVNREKVAACEPGAAFFALGRGLPMNGRDGSHISCPVGTATDAASALNVKPDYYHITIGYFIGFCYADIVFFTNICIPNNV